MSLGVGCVIDPCSIAAGAGGEEDRPGVLASSSDFTCATDVGKGRVGPEDDRPEVLCVLASSLISGRAIAVCSEGEEDDGEEA